MNFRAYSWLVFQHTFRRSVILTDRASILIGPLMTAYFWVRGRPLPEGLDGLIATGVLFTAGGALLLRLLSAPYVIWRRDQKRIVGLAEQLDSPGRDETVTMKKFSTDLRKELSAEMARFLEYSQLSNSPALFKRFVSTNEDVISSQGRVTRLLWQLGHDVFLRVACWNLMTFCAMIIESTTKGDFDTTRSDRLRKQARFTMALIHSSSGEDHALALAQLEALLKDYGETLFTVEGLPRPTLPDIDAETPL